MCDKSGTSRTRTKTGKSHSRSTGAGSPGPCDIGKLLWIIITALLSLRLDIGKLIVLL